MKAFYEDSDENHKKVKKKRLKAHFKVQYKKAYFFQI